MIRTLALAGLTALLLAGCSSADPDPEETTVSAPATNSAPSTDEASPEETPEEGNDQESGEEDNTAFENKMFLSATGGLESSLDLTDEEVVELGRGICEKLDASEMKFPDVVDWVNKEGGLLDEDETPALIGKAIGVFCPNNSDRISEIE